MTTSAWRPREWSQCSQCGACPIIRMGRAPESCVDCARRAERRAHPNLGLLTPLAGDVFTLTRVSPWSGPCVACGKPKPTHYISVKGGRRRVTCHDHKRHEGIEVMDLQCQIVETNSDEGRRDDGGGIRYVTLGPTYRVNPCPGTEAFDQKGLTGGMTLAYWRELVESGEIR